MVDILTILLISIPAGFIGSLTGLGGGSITTPLLVILGVPVKYAIAASMVTIIATSSGSAVSYVKEKIANVKVAMYLEMFTIIGAIIGASITSILEPRLLYFFFAAFLLTSFLGIRRHIKEEVPVNVKQSRLAKWLELQGTYWLGLQIPLLVVQDACSWLSCWNAWNWSRSFQSIYPRAGTSYAI